MAESGDEPALVAALQSGHLAGAALDIFPVEPPGSDHPLLALANVIATPHVGGNTVEVATHQGEIIAGDLARLFAGERPRHVLNPEMLARFDWTRPRPAVDSQALATMTARPGPAVTDIQRGRPRSAPAGPLASPAAPPPTTGVPPEVLEGLTRIVQRFTAQLGRDEALGRFAVDKGVTLRFTLTDAGIVFFLRLRRGSVVAALGDPDAPADVELAMRAEVLDGMFTGRVNPMQAATAGRLSFRGDTVKAMTLQQVQADLTRCYAEARAEVGDPGDLAALAPFGGARRVAPAPALTPGDVRDELIQVVNELYTAGLVTATGGNASVRVPAHPGPIRVRRAANPPGDDWQS